jgi:hypothetical protein
MRLTTIAILLILFSCNSKTEKATKLELKTGSITSSEMTSSPIFINNERYEYVIKNDHFYMLIHKSDTIVKAEDYYFAIEILDINEDGFEDLRVFAFSNMPNQCDNYLYSPENQKFSKIENTMLDIKKLPNSNRYFTYFSMGCADSDWTSELGFIRNNEFVIIGEIKGYGCDTIKENRKIEISKLSPKNSKLELFQTLDFDEYINDISDKWVFIESYWNKNEKKY